MEAKLPRQPRRTQQQITDLLSDFRGSDKSSKEFCELHHINPVTFHKWQTRKKEKVASEASSFASLQFVSPANGLFAEVGTIRLYQPVTASFLKELAG